MPAASRTGAMASAAGRRRAAGRERNIPARLVREVINVCKFGKEYGYKVEKE